MFNLITLVSQLHGTDPLPTVSWQQAFPMMTASSCATALPARYTNLRGATTVPCVTDVFTRGTTTASSSAPVLVDTTSATSYFSVSMHAQGELCTVLSCLRLCDAQALSHSTVACHTVGFFMHVSSSVQVLREQNLINKLKDTDSSKLCLETDSLYLVNGRLFSSSAWNNHLPPSNSKSYVLEQVSQLRKKKIFLFIIRVRLQSLSSNIVTRA